jgi:hypothetical protein
LAAALPMWPASLTVSWCNLDTNPDGFPVQFAIQFIRNV